MFLDISGVFNIRYFHYLEKFNFKNNNNFFLSLILFFISCTKTIDPAYSVLGLSLEKRHLQLRCEYYWYFLTKAVHIFYFYFFYYTNGGSAFLLIYLVCKHVGLLCIGAAKGQPLLHVGLQSGQVRADRLARRSDQDDRGHPRHPAN